MVMHLNNNCTVIKFGHNDYYNIKEIVNIRRTKRRISLGENFQFHTRTSPYRTIVFSTLKLKSKNVRLVPGNN